MSRNFLPETMPALLTRSPTSEALGGLLGPGVDFGAIRDVAAKSAGCRASAPGASALESFQSALVEVPGDDFRSASGEAEGEEPADPSCPARDYRSPAMMDLIGEV